MRIARLNSLDVAVEDDEVFALIKEGNTIRLVELEPDLKVANELASFRGSKAFLLKAGKPFLVSVDDALILIEGGSRKVVLRANRPENFFWRSTEANGRIFVQEYGQPPTGIYVSEGFEGWRRIVTNTELDKHSKHFHSISWDPYRNWLIATLGDGCLTRAVYSEDLGRSWRPLYKG
ncbi:MAG: hypothetical protein N3H31_06760, partial [Candidatus Nezhaarchaeota archaeon]|nr:hypothetical protein [Candidatus Nezhaarchaeota archaeon]